jgi:hypothetical protein
MLVIACEIMAEIFPADRSYFYDLARQAALSRLWAGIHFEQDVVNGMDQGMEIGKRIIKDMHKEPHPFIFRS